MGYTTTFKGKFNLNKELDNKTYSFLKKLNETRRMKRRVAEKFGVEGEFYVKGGGDFGQDDESNIMDYNSPPRTQPGLWCQWRPSRDRLSIEWDEGEKFYAYDEWIEYIINKILAPNGYVLNGTVEYFGEERSDVGEIIIKDNVVKMT